MNKVSKHDQALNNQLTGLGADKVSKNSNKLRNRNSLEKPTKASGNSYDVDLSTNSKTVRGQHKKAYDIAKASPDIREQKVAELKEKIKNGTYQIDSGKIADGILKEAIRDHLANSE